MRLVTAAWLTMFAAVAAFCVYLTFANAAFEGDDLVTLELGGGDSAAVKTPVEYRRPPDQTFLTFPEWFLVHSPAEYADHVRNGRPSDFPFFRHIGQFWQSYAKVAQLARRHFPFNAEYHTMIVVIGASTTVEYGLKGAYETVIGRLTELISYKSSEDRVAAAEAKSYVDFIKVDPWYKFDFITPLKAVWQDNGFASSDFLRKLDRRYLLTTEFLAKAAYGFLIGKATASAFAAPVPTTAVVTDRDLPSAAKDAVRLKTFDDGSVLWTLPRYAAFTDASLAFAQAGAEFQEVAGNRGVVLVSVLVPSGWRPRTELFDTLFAQPIVTKPNLKRLALIVPVKNLSATLRMMSAEPFAVEHVYDF